ncbi:MAG: HD-GYP domain-containing protein [Clostridiales bacterium]
MIKLPLSNIKTGMKLARDVILDDGRILLLSGFVIKPRYKRKLEMFNIPYIYINKTKSKLEKIYPDESIYSSAIKTIKNIFNEVRDGYELDIDLVRETVNNLLGQISQNNTLIQLTGISDIKSYTYVHSVDVCIYSLNTAIALNYNRKDLVNLGIAAILHDIGKSKIPIEIMEKPGVLSENEFNIMKLHTIYGYEILTKTDGLKNSIANVAWQHHEKINGKGYPLGLKNSLIPDFAKIVSISDVFDALSSDKIYKKKMLPHKVKEVLLENVSKQFDPYFTKVFIENIILYPKNLYVQLDNGYIGVIIKENKKDPAKPILRINSNDNVSQIIDLSKNTDLNIIDILS